MVVLDSATTTSQPVPIRWVMRKSSDYNYDELAHIFNETRIDYIVPMPMNGRRMEDYVRDYDVDLRNSLIVTDPDGHPAGMGMIAFREQRAWLTRLGVVPHLRHHKLGHMLMTGLIERAYALFAKHIQLEVIVGNEPAKRLFHRHGFEGERELSILNRPPARLETQPADDIQVTALEGEALHLCLAEQRHTAPSWLDESASLLKSEDITGFSACHRDGSSGWVLFRKARFQMSHFAINVPPTYADAMLTALFHTIHKSYPSLDAKMENFPAAAPGMAALQKIGYIEVFRRIEMHRDLR